MSKRKSSRKPHGSPTARVLEPRAPGVDIVATEIYVAVPRDRNPQPVRHFGTFTLQLEPLADWLKPCSIETVAMESIGVFWILLFQFLGGHGFRMSRICRAARPTSPIASGCNTIMS
jgi:transposase